MTDWLQIFNMCVVKMWVSAFDENVEFLFLRFLMIIDIHIIFMILAVQN